MDLNGGMVENKLENLSPYQWMEQHFFARQIPRDWPSLLALYLNFHGRLGRVELALRGALLLGGRQLPDVFPDGLCLSLYPV